MCGFPPPPEKRYKTPLGGSFSKRTVRLTVTNLSEHEIEHYREELQGRFRKMVPGLSPAQLASLMVEVEDNLRKGGTFVIKLPSP